ncbi:thrombospondin type 3 repeat-containing protein [Myxococcota bacterium]|nr:thrombospondin type 3 repeat-containing protein [Myxococcota bacterium]
MPLHFSGQAIRTAYTRMTDTTPWLNENHCNTSAGIYPDQLVQRLHDSQASLVPQWRSPERHNESNVLTHFIQPDYLFDLPFNKGSISISVPPATIAEYLVLLGDDSMLSANMAKQMLACGSPPVMASPILMTVFLSTMNPVRTYCNKTDYSGYCASKGRHEVVLVGWMMRNATGWAQAIADAQVNNAENLTNADGLYFIIDNQESFRVFAIPFHIAYGRAVAVQFNFSQYYGPEDDEDQDEIPDVMDNCPLVYNPSQEDMDGDKTGDPCDPDADGDGVYDEFDEDDLDGKYALDLNENGLFEGSSQALQVGNKFTPQCSVSDIYCDLLQSSFAAAHLELMYTHDKCIRRNIFHPSCMEQVRSSAGLSLIAQVPNYIRKYNPCAILHQTKLLSFQPIEAWLDAGYLTNIWGTSARVNLNDYISLLEDDCFEFFQANDPVRNVATKENDILFSRHLGGGWHEYKSCKESFGTFYNSSQESPVYSTTQGWHWEQAQGQDRSTLAITGCLCQGDDYPFFCTEVCPEINLSAGPAEEPNILETWGKNYYWDFQYAHCPDSNGTQGFCMNMLPRLSGPISENSIFSYGNQVAQKKTEIFDYDKWIALGGYPENYGKFDSTQPGQWQARYSVGSYVWASIIKTSTISFATHSSPVHFAAGSTCSPSMPMLENWIPRKIKIIPWWDYNPGAWWSPSTPLWGQWIGDTQSVLLEFDSNGTNVHQMVMLPDEVSAAQLIAQVPGVHAKFVVATSDSGVLVGFRNGIVSSGVYEDQGRIVVSRVPPLQEASFLPFAQGVSWVFGLNQATNSWEIYDFTYGSDTGALTLLARFENALSMDIHRITDTQVWIAVSQGKKGLELYNYDQKDFSLLRVYDISSSIRSLQSWPKGPVGLFADGSVLLLDESLAIFYDITPPTVLLEGAVMVPGSEPSIWTAGTADELIGLRYYDQPFGEWSQFSCIQPLKN